ncbi:MAG: PDZ domain-containing protein [Flavobacteriales bacterium]
MKAGDVVIKMGDHEVPDMMGYMKALGMFKKGDQTTVEVLRDGKPMTVHIKFQ